MTKLTFFLLFFLYLPSVAPSQYKEQVIGIVFEDETMIISDTLACDLVLCNQTMCKPNYYVKFTKGISQIVTWYKSSDAEMALYNSSPLIEDYYFTTQDSAEKVFNRFHGYFKKFDLDQITQKQHHIFRRDIVAMQPDYKRIRIIQISCNDLLKADRIYKQLEKDTSVSCFTSKCFNHEKKFKFYCRK